VLDRGGKGAYRAGKRGGGRVAAWEEAVTDVELETLRAIAGRQYDGAARPESSETVALLIKQGLVRTMKDELRLTGAGMIALGRTPPPPSRGRRSR